MILPSIWRWSIEVKRTVWYCIIYAEPAKALSMQKKNIKKSKNIRMFIICPSALRPNLASKNKTLASSRKHKNKKHNICGPSPPQDKLNLTSICHLVPKSYLSEILWRFRNIMMLFKGPLSYQEDNWFSFSLDIFSPNSNSFPLNSNIADTQQSKNPFSYTDKETRKGMFSMHHKSPKSFWQI